MVNIFWRIFWIQHIHCLFSSLCVVVSEFGRNMKFNRKKNHTAGLRLPKLTEVVCMQLNILVWTMIDCNYNPHKNMPTFYSNHLSTFKVEQIIIKTLLLQENKAGSVSLYPHLSDCFSAIFPITPPSAAWGTISGQWSAWLCHHIVCSWPGPPVSQWEASISLIWPIRAECHCLWQCVPPDWVKLFWRPLDGEGVTLHH